MKKSGRFRVLLFSGGEKNSQKKEQNKLFNGVIGAKAYRNPFSLFLWSVDDRVGPLAKTSHHITSHHITSHPKKPDLEF